MLEATHTKHAPWTLVDFNDQRRGRLTLIRHLLDAIPDHAVPDAPSTSRRWGTRR
jgi:polyphosphate kinase 2 (PPK2 family)